MKIILYPLFFILLYFYASAFELTIIDDAFIQFQYAKNLANNGVWGFYSDQTANTATSPLNVILLALFTWFAPSTVKGAIWLTASLLFAFLLILDGLSRAIFKNRFFGILLFVAVATNLLVLSCIGMEVLLYSVLWIASVWMFLCKRRRLLAALLALLTLARPDGFLMFVILLVAVSFQTGPRKEKLHFILIYVCVLFPWVLYSWIQLGSFVPDTLFLKASQQSWGKSVSFGSGLVRLYISRFPFEVLSSFLLLPLFFFIRNSLNPAMRSAGLVAIAYGVIHYAAYSAIRVPPYHWYYAPFVLVIAFGGSLGSAILAERHRILKPVLALIVIAPLIVMWVKQGFAWREAPIHTNWATHDQYRVAGKWIQQNTPSEDTFLMGGEIGTLAYYSERRLLNNFSDPWSLRHRLYRSLESRSALLHRFWRWNLLWREEKQRYKPARYRIEHVLHPHEPREGPNIVHSWATATKWIPAGRLYLRRTRQP